MIHWVITVDPSMQTHPVAWMINPNVGGNGGSGGMTQLLSPTRSPPGTGTHDSNNHHNSSSSSSSNNLAYGQQPVTRRILSAHGTSPLSRLNATRGTSAHSPSKGSVSGQGQGAGLGSGQYNSIGASSPTNSSNNNNNSQRQTLPMGTDDGLTDPPSQGGIPGAWAYFIARIFEYQDSLSHPHHPHHQESSISNGQNSSNHAVKGGKPIITGNGATNVEGVSYMLDTLREGIHASLFNAFHLTSSQPTLTSPPNISLYRPTLSSHPPNPPLY